MIAPPVPDGVATSARARWRSVSCSMKEEWPVPDVYLLTEGPAGDVAVPDLRLTFTDSGLALDRADGARVWDTAWDGLEEMSPVERSILPDGRDGVVMVVVEQGRELRHRFVLGTDDAASTEALIRDRAAAHGLRSRSPRRAVSRPLMTVVVLAALAAMAALLLSATHVIHL
jgi:hypothetical protein